MSKDIATLVDEVRENSQFLSDRLTGEGTIVNDDEMREELAGIAARMIAIVAQNEGLASPIRNMISGKGAAGEGHRKSLAQRASELLLEE